MLHKFLNLSRKKKERKCSECKYRRVEEKITLYEYLKIFKFSWFLNLKEKKRFIALAAFCGETCIVERIFTPNYICTMNFQFSIDNVMPLHVFHSRSSHCILQGNSIDKLFIHELDNVCNSPTILLKRSHLCVNFLSGTVRAKES